MNVKVLVIGATGQIGREVVSQLLRKGAAVRAAVHTPARAETMGWRGVDMVPFSYADPSTFPAAFNGVDSLFVVSPPTDRQADVLVIPALDTARKAGVKRIVNLSALGVEADDSLALRKVERFVEQSGLEYTLLRPNWFMQNFNTTLRDSIRHQGLIALPAGDAQISFIDVRDVADVAARALLEQGHQTRAYTLTGDEALDHFEVAAILSKMTGKEIIYKPLSDDQMTKALTQRGWQPEAAEALVGLYQMVRQGWAETVTRDVAKVLGREPLSFEQYAEDFAEAWA